MLSNTEGNYFCWNRTHPLVYIILFVTETEYVQSIEFKALLHFYLSEVFYVVVSIQGQQFVLSLPACTEKHFNSKSLTLLHQFL